MTLHVRRETLAIIERLYQPLADELQSRLDTLTLRIAIVLATLDTEARLADHGTATISAEEQELLRHQARELVLAAEALAEALWEITGEPAAAVIDDVRVMQQGPRYRAAAELLGLEAELAPLQTVTEDLAQLPVADEDDVVDAEVYCAAGQVGPDGLHTCTLLDGHDGPHQYSERPTFKGASGA